MSLGINFGILSGIVNTAPVNPYFISTWDTTQAGSASDTIVLPMTAGPTVDWGDGTVNNLNTHTYASGGVKTLTISGTIEGFRFNNAGDKLKITNISNWGTFNFTTDRMFQGCSNMDVTAIDTPIISTTSFIVQFYNTGITTVTDWSSWDMSSVTTYELCFSLSANFNCILDNWGTASTLILKSMFVGANAFNQDLDSWVVTNVTSTENFMNATAFDGSVAGWILNGSWFRAFNGASVFTGKGVDTWDVSGMTEGFNMFVNAVLFNGNTSGWDTSSLLKANNMIYNCDAYDQDMSGWDINQVTNFTGFMQNSTGLSTANYDALLIGWDAQGAMSFSGTVNFGGSQYTSGGAAEAARTSLISKWGGITDGGAA